MTSEFLKPASTTNHNYNHEWLQVELRPFYTL